MSSGRPFKKFFCDRPEAFLLPPAAFKIWMYHYARENADRKSWPSIETLMEKCDLGRKAVYQWRAWLQAHGWLVKTGEIKGRNHGEFGIPIFTVRRGTIPPSRHPKSGSRLHTPPSPQKGDSDAYPKGSPEVDSEKQVDSVSTAALSKTQMESELQAVWNYYLAAFDKEEIISPSKKRMGMTILSGLHKRSLSDPAAEMTHAIDMARHIVKTQTKKSYFSKWSSIFGKWDTFQSLHQQCRDEEPPEAATLETTEGDQNGKLL